MSTFAAAAARALGPGGMTEIVCFVYDISPGGIVRSSGHVRSATKIAAFGRHSVDPDAAGLSLPPSVEAGVVSHIDLP